MSLLSIDITKIKRLSLDEVKLPAPENRVKLTESINPPPEPNIKPQEIDKPKLIALAQKIVKEYNSYTKEDLIELIEQATNVAKERAERGFNLMLQATAIEPTLEDKYYLTGSAPF